MVPDRYKYRHAPHPVRMIVRGADGHPLSESSVKVSNDSPTVPIGHYVVRATLQTRIAFWFVLTGHLGDLRTPCNWALVFVDQ